MHKEQMMLYAQRADDVNLYVMTQSAELRWTFFDMKWIKQSKQTKQVKLRQSKTMYANDIRMSKS